MNQIVLSLVSTQKIKNFLFKTNIKYVKVQKHIGLKGVKRIQ